MEQQWHPVADPLWSNVYEVTRDGRVRSKDRTIVRADRPGHKIRLKGRELKRTVGTRGYYVVNFQRNDKPHTQYVHRLVAAKFVEGDNSLSVNHKDGTKLNNNAENLEWITLAENTKHQHRTGLMNPSGQFVKGWRPKIEACRG